MAIKEPVNDKQKLFFKVLFETQNKQSAREAAGYSRVQMTRLCHKYVEYIHSHMNGMLAAEGLVAVKKLVDSMEFDGETSIAAKQVQMAAAKDILDRQGFVKAERIDLNLKTDATPLFVLPAKEVRESNIDFGNSETEED